MGFIAADWRLGVALTPLVDDLVNEALIRRWVSAWAVRDAPAGTVRGYFLSVFGLVIDAGGGLISATGLLPEGYPPRFSIFSGLLMRLAVFVMVVS